MLRGEEGCKSVEATRSRCVCVCVCEKGTGATVMLQGAKVVKVE